MITSSPATAKRRRGDAAAVKALRMAVMERDGGCRANHHRDLVGECEGRVAVAHWGDWRRFKTRGMAPEERHQTKGALALCRRHHQDYDGHQILIVSMTDQGCDGPLFFALKAM